MSETPRTRGRKNIFWLVTKPFWDEIGCEIFWPEFYNISFIPWRSDNLFSFLFVQATITQRKEIRENTSWHYFTVICSTIKQLILKQFLFDHLWLALTPDYQLIFLMPAWILISATDWLIAIAWWLLYSVI